MPASSKTELATVVSGYALCARAEGKSPKTIEALRRSAVYLEAFLTSVGLSTDAAAIGPAELRQFIVYLRDKPRFLGHPYIRPDGKRLSGYTISLYLRSLRAFRSWLVSEEIVPTTPFARVKIPKPPRKIVPAFSPEQFQAMVSTIDTSTPEGYRNVTMLTVLLDTALRVSELTGLEMKDMHLEEGYLKVFGKANKERLIPVGKTSRRMLWHYVNRFRPRPARPGDDSVFLTRDGLPMGKNLLEDVMATYGRRAGIAGVRCSPHTLRHTGAVMYLRNGGDVFTLQAVTGHSSLNVLRNYVNLNSEDGQAAHKRYSPVDNLRLPRWT